MAGPRGSTPSPKGLRLTWGACALALGVLLLVAASSVGAPPQGAPAPPAGARQSPAPAPGEEGPPPQEALLLAPDAAMAADPTSAAPDSTPAADATSAADVAAPPSQEAARPEAPLAVVQAPARAHDSRLLPPPAPVRVPHPIVPPGPRRIGLQAGHWQTELVPDELRRLENSTGASWGTVTEWQVNLDVANRVAALLRSRGYQVDVLPTTVPEHYLADVFLALHADAGNDPASRGYKAAHGTRRGPYEDELVQTVMQEYGRTTGLPVDPVISRNMRGYYAFSWSRFKSSVAPHTPAALLEMGFLTSAADRTLLLGQPDIVAAGVAAGVQRFLDDVPAGAPFADDLVLPPPGPFRPPAASS